MSFKEDIEREAEQLAVAGKQRQFHVASRGPGSLIELRGKKLTDLTAWDYLDLRTNRTVVRTLQEATQLDGLGVVSPRLIGGTSPHHVLFEEHAAKFLGFPRALLFSSRNQGVLSIITSICFERDLIFHSEDGTLPIPDAGVLVGCETTPFRSSHIETLETGLREADPLVRKLVFIESISPTTGEATPIDVVTGLCQRFGALLVVDESFALGSFGVRGAGYIEPLLERGVVSAVVADLSYGVGGFGCVVAGGLDLCSIIAARSRTFSREPAMPSFLCEVNQSLLTTCERSGTERQKLRFVCQDFRSRLSGLGFMDLNKSDSPIVCLKFPTPNEGLLVANGLSERGFHVEHLVSTSPTGLRGVVRMVLSSRMSEAQLVLLVEAVAEVITRATKRN